MTLPDRRLTPRQWARYERNTARLYGAAMTAFAVWLIILGAALVAL